MALSDIDKSPLYIDSINSRVGIGTTSANKSSSSTALTVNTSSAGNYSALELSSGDTLNWYINSNNTAVYDVTAGTRPRIFYTNGSERMRIDSGGKVGIGTVAPDLALHVEGTNGAPASSGSTPTGFLSLRQKDGGASHGANIGVLGVPPWGTWIQGQDANNLATSYPLLLNPNGGNVGIGTSSPAYNLDVYNPASTGAPLLARFKSAGGDTQLYVDNSTITTQLTADSFSNSGIVGTLTNHPFVFRTNNTERMRISSGGEITYNNEPTSGGGVNVSLSAAYNDTSNHTVGTVNTQSFALITINTSNGATHIPVYRNGGAGVAYGGTMLDPDNQTWVALGTSITFNQPGSFPQTFVVSITSGGSQLNVQRTSGSNAYYVYVQLLG